VGGCGKKRQINQKCAPLPKTFWKGGAQPAVEQSAVQKQSGSCVFAQEPPAAKLQLL